MKILLDTHIILWAASAPDKLSKKAKKLLQDETSEFFFSAANIWELAIKSSIKPQDFYIDVRILRRNLLDNEYTELPITSSHTAFIQNLPPIHKDPFDRLLIAQATDEGLTLLTADTLVAQYPGPIIAV